MTKDLIKIMMTKEQDGHTIELQPLWKWLLTMSN